MQFSFLNVAVEILLLLIKINAVNLSNFGNLLHVLLICLVFFGYFLPLLDISWNLEFSSFKILYWQVVLLQWNEQLIIYMVCAESVWHI